MIEKCLEHNSQEMKNLMVEEIMTCDNYYDFLTNQYGNYVIQKSLAIAVEPTFSKFI